MEDRLELASQNSDIVGDFVLAHELEHVVAVVGRRLPFPLQELNVHQRISSFDCDGLSFVTEVYQLESESSDIAAVDFGSVEERKSHPPILALRSEVRNKVGWSEDHLI